MTKGFKCDKCKEFIEAEPLTTIDFKGDGLKIPINQQCHICGDCSLELYKELFG